MLAEHQRHLQLECNALDADIARAAPGLATRRKAAAEEEFCAAKLRLFERRKVAAEILAMEATAAAMPLEVHSDIASLTATLSVARRDIAAAKLLDPSNMDGLLQVLPNAGPAAWGLLVTDGAGADVDADGTYTADADGTYGADADATCTANADGACATAADANEGADGDVGRAAGGGSNPMRSASSVFLVANIGVDDVPWELNEGAHLDGGSADGDAADARGNENGNGRAGLDLEGLG